MEAVLDVGGSELEARDPEHGLTAFLYACAKGSAEGIRALAAGRYDIEVDDTGGDEINALAGDVNRLARRLADTEQARQRWMADP